jgi:hypothetical protein
MRKVIRPLFITGCITGAVFFILIAGSGLAQDQTEPKQLGESAGPWGHMQWGHVQEAKEAAEKAEIAAEKAEKTAKEAKEAAEKAGIAAKEAKEAAAEADKAAGQVRRAVNAEKK